MRRSHSTPVHATCMGLARATPSSRVACGLVAPPRNWSPQIQGWSMHAGSRIAAGGTDHNTPAPCGRASSPTLCRRCTWCARVHAPGVGSTQPSGTPPATATALHMTTSTARPWVCMGSTRRPPPGSSWPLPTGSASMPCVKPSHPPAACCALARHSLPHSTPHLHVPHPASPTLT